jgi:hypothetical protein
MQLWRSRHDGQETHVAKADAPAIPRTTDEALQLIRATLEQHSEIGYSLDALRSPVKVLCRLARAEKIPPERVLIDLKNALHSLPALDGLEPAQREATRSRVVQLAINAYFDGD